MAAAPLVSVVIPALSPGPFLAETLASVAAQGHRPIEIVVVDDGSPAPVSVPAMGDLAITVLRRPHRGVSAARNAGLDAARGTFVAFLDADDLWTPGALRRLIDAHAAAPGHAAVHGQVQMFRRDAAGADTRLRSPYFGFNLGSILVTRAAALGIGGFDEALHFSEDVDFLVRLKESGAHRQPIEALVLLYRRGHGGATERVNLAQDRQRNIRNWANVLAASLARRRKASGG